MDSVMNSQNAMLLESDAPAGRGITIGSLVSSRLSIPGHMAIGEVVRVLEANPDVDGLAVLDGPDIGFVSRPRLLSQVGSKFGYALYERKEIRMLMEKDTLIVEASLDPVHVIGKATQRDAKRIYDDIVVTERGEFAGLVSLRSLMAHNKDILTSSMSQVSLLDEKTRKLEHLNRVQAEFVATMTHELRAPLNSMLGVGRLLLMDPRLIEDHRGAVDILLSKGSELLGLVNNILDFYKIESGAMKPLLDEMDLAPVIEDVRQAAGVLLKGKPVTLDIHLHALPHPFVCDPVFVRRILTNLLSNAVKFTESGSITLTAVGKHDQVVLSVQDTGIGIPPEEIPLLFRKFTQMESSSIRRHDGTGLGLAIVRNLVESLGGSVSVESTPGVGSTFTVWLKSSRLPAQSRN
jgi:signal transduction histidine kinase